MDYNRILFPSKKFMKMTQFLFGLSCMAFLSTLIAGIMIYQMRTIETTVSFLDVGQGDAILISEGSQQILIDGGPSGRILRERIAEHMPFWDHTIELVIATHPDRDHIDGLVELFALYDVQHFWITSAEKDTAVFEALMREAHRSQAHIRSVTYGDRVQFASGGELSVVYPYKDALVAGEKDDLNAGSIATLFSIYGEQFFFGGDLPREVEDHLPLTDTITVLKAGHHGSDTSTSSQFLARTTPHDIIFSAGQDNRYGHPDVDVLNRSLRSGARIFRTDQDGTITYKCSDERCGVVF